MIHVYSVTAIASDAIRAAGFPNKHISMCTRLIATLTRAHNHNNVHVTHT